MKIEDEIIKKYSEEIISIKQLSREYNINVKKIRNILLSNNIQVKSSKEVNRRYTHTYDYFENINTEEKAYWLGFILADGYITCSKGYNVLGIEIKNSDINHLYKFKNDICATNPVKEYHKNSTFGEQDNCRITLNSQKTIIDLQNLGITSNKSYDGIFPLINNKLIRHMIRGYFDGNGYIGIIRDKFLRIDFCGTKDILENIERINDICWRWHERHKDRDNNNYTISISKQTESEKFLKYMYDDCSVYLDRKFKKYKEYFNI